jgi:NAD(P)-dependent dehydrogenase (short-subunit alcohol dehydrogenase family)
MKRFEGKVVLITGAASGIGKASVLRIAEEGGKVVCADVAVDAAKAVADEVRSKGGEAFALACDVSNPADAERTVAAAIERYGRLDTLCNIAGILRFDNTHELTIEAWNQVIAVNLTGTFLMCRAALHHLIAARGSIVNMSSSAALAGHPWTAPYSASKGGILSMTYALAVEYGRQGLRVNVLCPGGVETPIQNAFRFPDGVDQSLLQRILPFDRMRGPETVAAALAFLASDDAAHINGTALRVDGGMLA